MIDHIRTAYQITTYSPAGRPEKLPMADKAVLLALADCANHAGSCFPSIAHLMKKTAASRATVLRALARLEAARLVSRAGSSGSGTTRYLVFSDPDAVPIAVSLRDQSRLRFNGGSNGGYGSHSETGGGLTVRPEAFAKLIAALRSSVGTHSFQTWIQPVRQLGSDGEAWFLQVPNQRFVGWLEEHRALFEAAAAAESIEPRRFNFLPAEVGALSEAQ